MKAPWIVAVRGEAESPSFEISVLRSDNELGLRSYGWFNESKLLITHNGGPCSWPLTQKVWDKQLEVAYSVAEELNDEESANLGDG